MVIFHKEICNQRIKRLLKWVKVFNTQEQEPLFESLQSIYKRGSVGEFVIPGLQKDKKGNIQSFGIRATSLVHTEEKQQRNSVLNRVESITAQPRVVH